MYLYRLLLAIFVFGLVGVLGELLLLEHFEDLSQRIPLGAIVLAIGAALYDAWRRSVASRRVFQAVLVACAASGLAGLYLHYRGNVEFELEMHPGAGGFTLVREALMGATPALAPGTMVLFAALGFATIAARSAVEPPRGDR